MISITSRTILELVHHEAIVRRAYKDSVGRWTWSVGVTSASGHSVERYINNPQPMQKCIDVFAWLLAEKYAPDVRRAFADYELTEAQFAAALSFHWNTGGIAKASWVEAFKSGDEKETYKRFMNWSKPPEIIPRREKERDLFCKGIWSNNGKAVEITRLKENYTPDWSSRKYVDLVPYIPGSVIMQPSPPDVAVIDTPSDLPNGGLLAAILKVLKGLWK